MRFGTFLFILLSVVSTHANTLNNEQVPYSDYYLIDEANHKNAAEAASSEFQAPHQILQKYMQTVSIELAAISYNLLQFVHMHGDFGTTPERYNRLRDFGTWIKDTTKQTCLNTRGVVLARDSRVPVSTTTSGCAVKGGEWQEPYTGRIEYDSSKLQIDHVVPLKNAYVSGAYQWDNNKRCLYANFLGNDFHLLAVDGSENMKKSDNGPEGYMPADISYTCDYLQHWMRIKMIWKLALNPDEVVAVEKLIQANKCDLNKFLYSYSELQAQRNFIQQNMNLCTKN